MGFTIVLGLAVLSIANYGHTFTITAADVKPTVKPFSPFQSFTTQQPKLGDSAKSTFGLKNEAPKPFGAHFEPFKQQYQPYQPFKQPYQPYQPYQPGPFRTNYQPFGPFPGYPGPVVYPGQIGYPSGPSFYSQQQHPAFHFDQHKQFGLQPSPSAPIDQTVSPFKPGSSKKFNKSPSGFSYFSQPGKYFQEHQFGAYHGPEFSSAIVPAEHNLKQSKPKDIFLGKPAIPTVPALPTFPSFGFSKEGGFGLPSPALFGYHSPAQPFFGTSPQSVKSVPSVGQNSFNTVPAAVTAATTTEVPSPSRNEEPATPAALEVTGESSSETPAADPQPTSLSQEEVTASVAAAAGDTTNNETPVADDTATAQQQLQSEQQTNLSEDNEPKNDNTDAVTVSAATGENTDSVQFTDSSQESIGSEPASEPAAVSIEETKETSVTDSPQESIGNEPASGPAAVPTEEIKETSINDGTNSDTSETSSEVTLSETSKDAATLVDAPKETAFEKSEPTQASPISDAINFPGQQAGVAVAASDSSAPNPFGSSGFPYFDKSIDLRQPGYPYFPNFASPVNFGISAYTEEKPVGQDEKTESITVANSPSPVESTATPAVPINADNLSKKVNTVQIIQDGSFDPFNGQLPLLYDPSSSAAGSPLDTYGFYNHPSVSTLSSQAALASYSPEEAFSNFGINQFRTQGYLVEGSPSLNPLPKTIVQTSRTPVSISSEDHPLHGQVFKYSQSFVPYPALVQAGNTADISSTTTTPVAVPVESSSSTTTATSA